MKRLKLFLDTSVISHLEAPDRTEWMADTRKLWDLVQIGEYDAFISPVVMIELGECPEPKYSVLLKWLSKIKYTELQTNDEVLELAEQYLKAGILPPRSARDRQHIAYACVYNCDMVISWNFKHIVNVKTIAGIKGVNALAGYKEMPIYTPTILISGGAEDDT
jgi:predicted nucleic acid-binding protein